MIESIQEFNGRLWLHELIYGTDKQLRFSAFERTLRHNSPDEVIAQVDEYSHRKSKLYSAVIELQLLLGSEIIASPIDEDGSTDAVIGCVESFDLSEGTITISDDSGEQTFPYCQVETDRVYGHLVTPTITMLADREYKF